MLFGWTKITLHIYRPSATFQKGRHLAKIAVVDFQEAPWSLLSPDKILSMQTTVTFCYIGKTMPTCIE